MMGCKPCLGAAIVLASISSSFSAYAYRTAENSAEFTGATRVGWATSDVPFVMSDTVPTGLSADAVTSTIGLALAQWSNAGCGQPKVWFNGYSSAGASPGDGFNTIHWVLSGWARLGYAASASAMTDVQFEQSPDGSWQIVEADIYLNAEGYDWSGMKDGSMNLGAVILHEAGHALGLLHPCEVDGATDAPDCANDPAYAAATMFPVYQTSCNQLGTDDIAGVCYLYPGGACSSDSCEPGYACTSTGCQPACGEGICLAGYGCSDGVCVEQALLPAPSKAEPDCETEPCSRSEPSGVAIPWDACQKSSDCAAGLTCSKRGYCTLSCVDDSGCPAEATCSKAGQCLTEQGVLGDSCLAAADCASQICIEQHPGSTVCTRGCNEVANDCPDGWSCVDPDGLGAVCAASPPESGCGCTVIGLRRNPPGFWRAIGVLLFGVALVRRQKRRG